MKSDVRASLGILAVICITGTATSNISNKKKYVSKLVSKSQTLRKNIPNFLSRELADDDGFAYDLSPYGVRFSQCQYVKTYDDSVAQNKYVSSVFSLKQFVVYRLCPLDSCDYCSQNYGEYVVDVQDYLDNVVDQVRDDFEELCEQCDKDCNDNNNNYKCSKCRQCTKVQELEESGYVDASYLTTCQKVQFDKDDDDDNAISLYVGPRCYSSGKMIKIDVFSDYQCTTPYGVNVEDVLGYKLHYYVLQRALGISGCTSCTESNNDENDNNKQEENGESLEFCQNLYTSSAKCESKHGFRNGLSSVDDSSVQLSNEYDACTFIDSLVWNSYDQNGEISYGEPQDAILRQLTTMQRLMVTLLACIVITSVVYANYLQKKIARHRSDYDEKLMGGYAESPIPKSPPSMT